MAGFDTSLTGQSDLDITRSRLDRLDVTRAAAVSRETCASPTSLVLALVYLERLRGSNPTYLHTVSSADLFLVSLVGVVIYIDANKETIVPYNVIILAFINVLHINLVIFYSWLRQSFCTMMGKKMKYLMRNGQHPPEWRRKI